MTKLPSFIVTSGLKTNVRNYELVEKKANYNYTVKWSAKDYVVNLVSTQKEVMDRVLTKFVAEIQKNLTGQRSGNIFKVKLEGVRKWITYTAADANEYPAVLTGRLVNSISFSDSITKQINKPSSTVPIKGKVVGKSRDFVKAPKPEKDKIIYVVGTNVPYAKDLEFSSPSKGGRPFMRRSLNENYNKIYNEVIEGMLRSGN